MMLQSDDVGGRKDEEGGGNTVSRGPYQGVSPLPLSP